MTAGEPKEWSQKNCGTLKISGSSFSRLCFNDWTRRCDGMLLLFLCSRSFVSSESFCFETASAFEGNSLCKS